MKGKFAYGMLLAIACALTAPRTACAEDKIAGGAEPPALIYASEVVQCNSGWNPDFQFEVNVSLASLHREARPVVLCEVFGPGTENPSAIVGWGKQYQSVNLSSDGSFSGRVVVPYKVPSRYNAEKAKRYQCFLYLYDHNRGILHAPGDYGLQVPAATVKAGTPLVWQVEGDIPQE